MSRTVFAARAGFIAALTLLTVACSTGEVPVVSPRAGLACVDDSSHCIGERKSALKALVDDPSRAWVKEKPDAAAYASGVRLFAYKTKKKDLSCAELEAGRREAEHAPAILRAPNSGLSTAQVARGVILAHEISRDLAREHGRRCKKA
ncbi:MAG: hypothetical protein NW216_03475 [Hyphomicrobium sp.]|nr:hypothetical protein [Hyphomicrobium sp.]